MKKTAAQLDREIREAIAQPVLGRKPLAEFAAEVGQVAKKRQKKLHQALLAHQAFITTDARGRKTLIVQSGEMSNPEEGAYRVTEYLEDGPRGHTTRKTIAALARDLSYDLAPVKIEPATETRVMAWMGTKEFADGSAHVFEMQQRNRR